MMLEWIVSSCFLILVVLALRAALGRKISARLRYALWALVLVRLLVPVQLFTSPVAGMRVQVSEQVREQMQEKSIYVLPVGRIPVEEAEGFIISEDGQVSSANSFGYDRLENRGETIVRYADKVSPLQILKTIWQTGAVVLVGILWASNLRFFVRLRRMRKPMEAIECPIPVYLAENLPSPCLFGVLRPAVYVTAPAAENPSMMRHVLAHELTHYRHLDHIWSILRGAALAVHWWNPLVWLAVLLSRRDGELACDEGALRQLGKGERHAYGETLLSLVTAKPSPRDLLSCATTMSGEKRSLRERVRRISCEPKQLVSAVIAVIILASATSVCAFGKAIEEEAASAGEDWWRTAQITVDEAGIPRIHYVADGQEYDKYGSPVPAPAEWAEQDLAGRNEAGALTHPVDGHLWAKLVSPDDGWLVVCWGQGTGIADTYVYQTADGGLTWTECAMPGLDWHVSAVGFLSPDRLIVAQELFDGAPVMITKDGGKTWEEIETLIDWDIVDEKLEHAYPVTDIYVYGSKVQMVYIGDFAMNWTMTSDDMGDTWTAEEAAPLDQFLGSLTAEDIVETSGQYREELVRLLHEASLNRGSRFYDYSTYEEQGSWCWSEYGGTVSLADGSVLHLDASSKGKTVYITWETSDSAPAAFYQSEELNKMICELGKSYIQEVLPYTPDLDHDGKPEKLQIAAGPDGMSWALTCLGETNGEAWSWFQRAYAPHVGWNALFLCKIDGEDYLLQYQPYMSGGVCDYTYKLFYLDGGREVTVRENSVSFDIVFNPDFADTHVFEPKKIAAFMDEINALLTAEDTVQLLNTDEELLGSFEKEGRLYDSLWWLDDDRDEDLTLLENLVRFTNRSIRESSVPDMRTMMAESKAEDFSLLEPYATSFAEGLHRAAEKLTACTGNETFVSWNSIPCEEYFPEKQYSYMLLTTDEENIVCILCTGWQSAALYSEYPDDLASTYQGRVQYSFVYRVEDEELYELVTQTPLAGSLLADEEQWFRDNLARRLETAQKNSFV